MRLWDLEGSKEVDRIDLSAIDHRPTALALAPDGRELVVGTARGVLPHCVARADR